MMSGLNRLFLWLAWGAIRQQWGRWLASLLMVAVGMALAVAIHLVNHSALQSFSRAIELVNGQSSLQLVASQETFPEDHFARLLDEASDLGIESASPALEIGTDQVRIVALDLFRAARVTPSLLPQAAEGGRDALFQIDSVFLSPKAMAALAVSEGDSIALTAMGRTVSLVVRGTVPQALGESVAVMDLGSAQWQFGRLGQLSRIDLRVREDLRVELLQSRLLQGQWPLMLVQKSDREQRMSNVSRAYRVNLTVLALVALVTGGFLISLSVALAVRRQQQLVALLLSLGAPLPWVQRIFLSVGVCVGLVGGALGAMAGALLAAAMLHFVGADLGGGYFRAGSADLQLDLLTMGAFMGLAGFMGWVAAWLSLRRTDWSSPAQQLRSSSDESLGRDAKPLLVFGFALLALAGLFALLPAWGVISFGGYMAMATLLVAAVATAPWLVANFSIAGNRLARWRLRQASSSSAALISGVVAAVALAVAMMVMVSSFRSSVGQWLEQVLPADLYSHQASAAQVERLSADSIEGLGRLDSVSRVEAARHQRVLLNPALPPVVLIAKPIGGLDLAADSAPRFDSAARIALPLVGEARLVGDSSLPVVFASEAMRDLYGWAAGSVQTLPLGGQAAQRIWVAGIFRDYGRQHGSVVMNLANYQAITGDRAISSISIWRQPGHSAAVLRTELTAFNDGLGEIQWVESEAIREMSLRIFDRSFAITYALEFVAILIALLTVAIGFSAQLMLREHEFGLLSQMGQSRGQRSMTIAWELGGLVLLGGVWGSLMGMLMSQVLIHKVNPESFHWTMQTDWPWGQMGLLLLSLVAISVVVAMAMARRIDERRLIQSLRADW
jgi:putative ABC transport system permease protein